MTNQEDQKPTPFYDMIGKHYPANELPERDIIRRMGEKMDPFEGTPPVSTLGQIASVSDKKNTLSWGILLVAAGLVLCIKLLDIAFTR